MALIARLNIHQLAWLNEAGDEASATAAPSHRHPVAGPSAIPGNGKTNPREMEDCGALPPPASASLSLGKNGKRYSGLWNASGLGDSFRSVALMIVPDSMGYWRWLAKKSAAVDA